jgi:transcription elongation factor Elf1
MSGLIYVNAQGMTACGANGKMDVDLKTHPDARVGNIDCPTCGEDMKVLASEVPMSHHVNSTLVCRISGQIMDSQNPPLSFPNGYVYSTNVSGPGYAELTSRRSRKWQRRTLTW